MEKEIKSRELVRKAIHFENPPLLPLQFRSDEDKSDIISIGYESPAGWEAVREGEDEWGCLWENICTGMGQVTEHPLEDLENFSRYTFPDPHIESRFENAKEKIVRYSGRYLLGSLGGTGFNRMFFLRGFENLLCDMYEDEKRFSSLADSVLTFENGIIEKFSGMRLDGVMFFDDWGTEDSLMINPGKWRQLFKPKYKEQFSLVHQRGMDVFFHSCGYVWDIIPDLIEIGVDVLNLEQPLVFGTDEIDGIERLAREFGGKVCFLTNADSQRTLNRGSAPEVQEEVEKIVEVFGKFGGGLIGLADATADHGFTPPENIEAMTCAFEQYRAGAETGR